jgi:hypothetical protein
MEKSMAEFERRTRIVTFRISEREFQKYTKLRDAEGAVSVSDLVRSALNRMLATCDPGSDNSMGHAVEVLGEMSRSLNEKLVIIAGLLREQRSTAKTAARNEVEPENEECLIS